MKFVSLYHIFMVHVQDYTVVKKNVYNTSEGLKGLNLTANSGKNVNHNVMFGVQAEAWW
mgnify:CR=1 FL=1